MGAFSAQQFTTKNGDPVLIRSATTEDAAPIMKMVSEIFKSSDYLLTEPDEFSVTLEQEQKWVESYTQSPNSVLLLAEMQDQLVGLLDFQGGHRRRIAHSGIIGTSIQKNYRGTGIGSILMRALTDWARETKSIERLELAVMADNTPAIALYKKMGFQEEGRKHKAIRLADGRYLDELLMARLL